LTAKEKLCVRSKPLQLVSESADRRIQVYDASALLRDVVDGKAGVEGFIDFCPGEFYHRWPMFVQHRNCVAEVLLRENPVGPITLWRGRQETVYFLDAFILQDKMDWPGAGPYDGDSVGYAYLKLCELSTLEHMLPHVADTVPNVYDTLRVDVAFHLLNVLPDPRSDE